MKLIRVIYAGGTIGMVSTPEGLAPSSEYIANKLSTWLDNQYEFISHEPLIDSSQVDLTFWQSLLALMHKDYLSYRATILLFGTDTLAYSSALISLMLPQDHSWVLTGSQKPWMAEGSDAADNIELSLTACRYPGTWIAFGGKVLNGINCFKNDSQSPQAFQSRREPSHDIAAMQKPLQPVNYQLLVATPGACYPSVAADDLAVLIVEGYGMGNLPVNDGLLAYIASLPKSCLLIISSQCQYGRVDPEQYASNHPLARYQPISSCGARREAIIAAVYAAWSLHNQPEECREWLSQFFASWC